MFAVGNKYRCKTGETVEIVSKNVVHLNIHAMLALYRSGYADQVVYFTNDGKSLDLAIGDLVDASLHLDM